MSCFEYIFSAARESQGWTHGGRQGGAMAPRGLLAFPWDPLALPGLLQTCHSKHDIGFPNKRAKVECFFVRLKLFSPRARQICFQASYTSFSGAHSTLPFVLVASFRACFKRRVHTNQIRSNVMRKPKTASRNLYEASVAALKLHVLILVPRPSPKQRYCS